MNGSATVLANHFATLRYVKHIENEVVRKAATRLGQMPAIATENQATAAITNTTLLHFIDQLKQVSSQWLETVQQQTAAINNIKTQLESSEGLRRDSRAATRNKERERSPPGSNQAAERNNPIAE